MIARLQYGIVFGKCDASEWMDWDISLTEEETALYQEAVRLGQDPNTVPGLHSALRRAYEEIEEEEIANALDMEDEYVMECQGCNTVDPYEIADLVHNRDPHALAFFGLTAADSETLDSWEPDEEDLPTVQDFDPDFEPESPFDSGWTMNVRFAPLSGTDIL